MRRMICMAPEGAQGGTPPTGDGAADPLKNIKAEFDRKLEAQTASISKLTETTQALLQQLQTAPKHGADNKNLPPPNPKKKFGERIYEDPDGAAADLGDEIENRIVSKLQKAGEANAKEQQIVATLRSDYPELWDVNSDLAQKAIEMFQKLPADERIPAMYRVCVKDAADELSILPAKKRPKGHDDFTLGQGRGGAGEGQGAGKAGQLDERTIAFAKAVGMDTDDPKVIESLKSRQRNSGEWLQYRAP